MSAFGDALERERNKPDPLRGQARQADADEEGREVSGAIRGPEPPFVGAVYQACTKSGRRWEVDRFELALPEFGWPEDRWCLVPMGDDVRGVTIDEEGRTLGGVRPITRTAAELRDHKKWRMVGTTARAT